MNLPDPLAEHLRPLFEALPIDEAMPELVVKQPQPTSITSILERLIDGEHVDKRTPLAAGLWLYVDELDRSHTISQSIADPTGSFWHGIMHRREGDFDNSHYWMRRTGNHPAIAQIQNYDPHTFIDKVESHVHNASEELVTMQRAEWAALFEWCAHN